MEEARPGEIFNACGAGDRIRRTSMHVV